MANVRDLLVRINGDASGLKKALGEVDKETTQAEKGQSAFGKTMGGVAVAGKLVAGAALAAGTAIAGAGVLGIKSAGDFEQSRVAFEVMLGSADKARSMMQDIATFAKSTPFELPEVVTGSKQLLAFGVAQENIIPTMRKLGDIAAGVGVPVGQLTNVFGQVKVAGRLMGQDLLQFTNAGVPMIEALSKVMGKPQEEIKKLVEQGKVGFPEVEAAINSLTTNGGKFGGMMEKQSQTFGGVVSNIKDGFGQILRSAVGINSAGDIVEGGIFDRVKDAAQKMMPVVQKIAEDIGPAVMRGFELAGQGIQTAVQAMKDLWNIVAPYIMPSIRALVDTFTTQLLPALQRLWNIVSPYIIPTLKVLGAILGGVIVAAVWIIINVLNVLFKVLGWLINIFIEIGQRVVWFVNLVIDYFKLLWNFWSTVFEAIFTIAKVIFMAIAVVIATVISVIMAVVQPIAEFIGGIFRKGWEIVSGVWNGVSGWFGRQFDGLRGALDKVTGWITAPFEAAWNFVKDIPGKIVSSITNVGQLLKEKIGDWDIPGPLGKVKDVIPGFATGVRNFRGGLAWVGEKGPELVNLPPGSDVFTAGESARMMSGASMPTPSNTGGGSNMTFSPTINVEMGVYAGMPIEKRQIAIDIWREIVREARAHGVQLPQIGTVIQ